MEETRYRECNELPEIFRLLEAKPELSEYVPVANAFWLGLKELPLTGNCVRLQHVVSYLCFLCMGSIFWG